ncbi:NUDIX domain-containing protein [Microbacterium sp.]|uniref:NUDIX domain-containing protein n=1 Tax=Microbacterium sp. TaxID=51671 RepID=UPI003F9C23A6
MTVDRSYIRVKAMLITPNTDGTRHLVSAHAPTRENPSGFHRLIGGGVELGETHRDAIIREIDEELGSGIVDLTHLGMIENIFRYNGELGHEIVALYTGRMVHVPSEDGGTLTESDGSIVPVVWRPMDDAGVAQPLYPAAARVWLREWPPSE